MSAERRRSASSCSTRVSGRPTGNSTYRYDATGKQFIFNWDTSAAAKVNCYRLRIQLADGSAGKVTVVQFK